MNSIEIDKCLQDVPEVGGKYFSRRQIRKLLKLQKKERKLLKSYRKALAMESQNHLQDVSLLQEKIAKKKKALSNASVTLLQTQKDMIYNKRKQIRKLKVSPSSCPSKVSAAAHENCSSDEPHCSGLDTGTPQTSTTAEAHGTVNKCEEARSQSTVRNDEVAEILSTDISDILQFCSNIWDNTARDAKAERQDIGAETIGTDEKHTECCPWSAQECNCNQPKCRNARRTPPPTDGVLESRGNTWCRMHSSSNNGNVDQTSDDQWDEMMNEPLSNEVLESCGDFRIFQHILSPDLLTS